LPCAVLGVLLGAAAVLLAGFGDFGNRLLFDMRVLLRDTRTGLYFREPAEWTAETEKAQIFKHSAEAMNRAREYRINDAEVILEFEESRYTVALPLP
jgi:hypothetical protein